MLHRNFSRKELASFAGGVIALLAASSYGVTVFLFRQISLGVVAPTTTASNLTLHASSHNSLNLTTSLQSNVLSSTLLIELSDYQSQTSPVQNLLKVYVYESLPSNLSTKLHDDFLGAIREKQSKILDGSEIAIINLFRTFPGRTWDPTEADVFVVPYAHLCHCFFAEGYSLYCGHLAANEVDPIFETLTFFNESTKSRHLFLNIGGEFHSHHRINAMPLLLTPGPRTKKSPPGHIVIPQFNDDPDKQPSVLVSRSDDWWTRPRELSFVFLTGYRNPRMRNGPRRFRVYFAEQIQKTFNNSVGGLPFVAEDTRTKQFDADLWYGKYKQSVFCPILAGDMAWQRRFFDVISCGCLPFVVCWQTPSLPGGKSWFMPEGNSRYFTSSVEESYPFYKRENDASQDPSKVDYESFVVECVGNSTSHTDMSNAKPTMEQLLSDPVALKKKQLAMEKWAVSFTFGLGADAHRYVDAFAMIIRSLRIYLDKHVYAVGPTQTMSE